MAPPRPPRKGETGQSGCDKTTNGRNPWVPAAVVGFGVMEVVWDALYGLPGRTERPCIANGVGPRPDATGTPLPRPAGHRRLRWILF